MPSDLQLIEAARWLPPEERFRRTAIVMVERIHDAVSAGTYSGTTWPNWHALQVFLLLRGDCMVCHCEKFLQLVLDETQGDERREILELLGGPLDMESDPYLMAICAEGSESP